MNYEFLHKAFFLHSKGKINSLTYLKSKSRTCLLVSALEKCLSGEVVFEL